MQIQIDEMNITIIKIEHRRMLLSGNLNIPYFMKWDNIWKCWLFTDASTPAGLKARENEISNQIENYESSIS